MSEQYEYLMYDVLVYGYTHGESFLPLEPGYIVVALIPSCDATQAACADDKYYDAISSTSIAMIDRITLKRVGQGTAADAKHLNAGYLWKGKIYCAYSNYPTKPDESDIRMFDWGPDLNL